MWRLITILNLKFGDAYWQKVNRKCMIDNRYVLMKIYAHNLPKVVISGASE